MKELLIIAIGSAIVNNVVLSQFLGICPFLGVSKRLRLLPEWVELLFRYYNCFIFYKFNLQIYFSTIEYCLFANDCIHPCNCSSGAVCRNVLKEGNAISL